MSRYRIIVETEVMKDTLTQDAIQELKEWIRETSELKVLDVQEVSDDIWEAIVDESRSIKWVDKMEDMVLLSDLKEVLSKNRIIE